MDTDFIKFIFATLVAIGVVVIGTSYMQQHTIETTCGVKVSLEDALFYDLDAASCPTVKIVK